MEFRFDINRMTVGDSLLLLDPTNQHDLILGSIRSMASIAWEKDSYIDKEEAIEKIKNMSHVEFESMVKKYLEAVKDYDLLSGLFNSK